MRDSLAALIGTLLIALTTATVTLGFVAVVSAIYCHHVTCPDDSEER